MSNIKIDERIRNWVFFPLIGVMFLVRPLGWNRNSPLPRSPWWDFISTSSWATKRGPSRWNQWRMPSKLSIKIWSQDARSLRKHLGFWVREHSMPGNNISVIPQITRDYFGSTKIRSKSNHSKTWPWNLIWWATCWRETSRWPSPPWANIFGSAISSRDSFWPRSHFLWPKDLNWCSREVFQLNRSMSNTSRVYRFTF